MKIAILDDYQHIALKKMADWSALAARAGITVFHDHLADMEALVERLAPFDIVCVTRERRPLPREALQRLPRLKLIASTGPRNASIDSAAAKELGIAVTATGYESTPTRSNSPGLSFSQASALSFAKIKPSVTAFGKHPSAKNSAARLWGSWGWQYRWAGGADWAPRSE